MTPTFPLASAFLCRGSTARGKDFLVLACCCGFSVRPLPGSFTLKLGVVRLVTAYQSSRFKRGLLGGYGDDEQGDWLFVLTHYWLKKLIGSVGFSEAHRDVFLHEMIGSYMSIIYTPTTGRGAPLGRSCAWR
jgi:hypothetical protein